MNVEEPQHLLKRTSGLQMGSSLIEPKIKNFPSFDKLVHVSDLRYLCWRLFTLHDLRLFFEFLETVHEYFLVQYYHLIADLLASIFVTY